MDWERISSNWEHCKRLAPARWAKLTEPELDRIGGRRDLLVAHISALYGISPGTAEMQLESWQGRLAPIGPPL